MLTGPPLHVLAAFGVAGCTADALSGGQGTSWRVGDLVLKPADRDEDEMMWQARTYSQIVCDGFRLAGPRAATDGSLCVDGWCATEYVAGRDEQGRWAEIIRVGERFHRAIRYIPRPPFLGERSSHWATGDRVAWGQIPCSKFAEVTYLPELADVLRPLGSPSQLIHGDLTGNVLFHDELAPTIIDFSPYWRPAAYASAVVVADALVWEGADGRVLDGVSHIENFGQYLVRALIFRLVTEWLLARDEPRGEAAYNPAWPRAIDIACALGTEK
ncbi:MAG: TIGR02569 family protein [Streptosporangiaceae bacterium]